LKNGNVFDLWIPFAGLEGHVPADADERFAIQGGPGGDGNAVVDMLRRRPWG
jgi:hypothetical protein